MLRNKSNEVVYHLGVIKIGEMESNKKLKTVVNAFFDEQDETSDTGAKG